MALKLWFPLNNNIKNIGLAQCSISSVPIVTPSYVAGPTNNALSFNGSTYWQSQNITLGTEATIACWSKTSANGKMTWVLASDGYAYLNLFESSIYTLNTGDSNNNPFRNSSNSNISVLHDNTWHHFAVTFGNSVAKLYIDGVYAGTALTFKSPKTSNKAIKIGGGFSNAHSYDWNGAIADFRVYDNCLGAEDIQRIYTDSTKMLQVSLPFNKDERNVGLSKIKTTNNGATVTTGANVGHCFYFNGNKQWVQFNQIFNKFYNEDFSSCFWVKPTDSTRSVILSHGGGSGVQSIAIELTTGRTVRLYWDATPDKSFTEAGALPLNAWTHVSLIKNGRVVKLYIDGILKETYTNSTDFQTVTSNKTPRIGDDYRGDTGNTVSFQGYLENFKLYNIALSEDDVKRIYTELSNDYQRIEFLKFNPGQRIDTGVLINTNNVVLTNAVMYYATGGSGRDLMGWAQGAQNYWGVTVNGTWEKATATNSDITKVNNVTYTYTAVSVTNGQYQIGALINGYSVRTKYIKSFKITIDGVVQRDFYACYRKSDNKYGMYDTITKTFYTNAGSGGDFTGI